MDEELTQMSVLHTQLIKRIQEMLVGFLTRDVTSALERADRYMGVEADSPSVGHCTLGEDAEGGEEHDSDEQLVEERERQGERERKVEREAEVERALMVPVGMGVPDPAEPVYAVRVENGVSDEDFRDFI
ncbi:hypothetical protein KIPB_004053 [Kipferlia bialata]|uniref:Uncharacterized protein n=1 Tax=Kipferlia bialata TaxID=797122 RepID=A0A9K3CPS6_9EUKA|nr:hypothetical protein KIPB_002170 [Kipferlia bialata]GIQ82839.1 hypothetical protein KIPB_004053 [Kipferlia bialata]|eukprot:g2170.t1